MSKEKRPRVRNPFVEFCVAEGERIAKERNDPDWDIKELEELEKNRGKN